MSGIIHHCNAIELLSNIQTETVDLIYTDPPFNTRKIQKSLRTGISYTDSKDNYIDWVLGWMKDCHRALKPTGTIYLHLDDHNVHKVKCHVMDKIFGEDNCLSTVIWSYNFGSRGDKKRWPAKHDTILVYTKEQGKHVFNWEDIDRVPYIAPAVQYIGRSKEEAEKRIATGQVPTDVWTMSIVGTASKERTGYPSQKPIKLIRRAIVASSNPGDTVLDPFAGSGTTADAALQSDRKFITCDESQAAIEVMKKRFAGNSNVTFIE